MQNFCESGSGRSRILLLTRWTFDSDVCGTPTGNSPPEMGGHTNQVHEPLDRTEPSVSGETHSESSEPSAHGEADEGSPIGGWFLEGPGIGPTAISLNDPVAPNLQLISKMFFTMKIVDISASF
jgi:hypothetical protein